MKNVNQYLFATNMEKRAGEPGQDLFRRRKTLTYLDLIRRAIKEKYLEEE